MDEEGFFESGNIDMAIEPPADGNESAEDSGDDDEPSVNNLAPQQLRANATVTVSRDGERHELVLNEDPSQPGNVAVHMGEQEEENEDAPAESQPKRRRAAVARQPVEWSENDLTTEERDRFQWHGPSETDAYADIDFSPDKLFELFFDDLVCDMIIRETLRYAAAKGDHDFKIDASKLKTFLAILIMSGYNTRPRRHQFWSNKMDFECDTISRAMSRNAFDAVMRYMHLADNTQLNKADKFAKVSIANFKNNFSALHFVFEIIIACDNNCLYTRLNNL